MPCGTGNDKPNPAVWNPVEKSAVNGSFQNMLSYQADRKNFLNRNWREDDGFFGPIEEELFQIRAERKKKWKREAE